ncbi:MAG: lipoprotein-releasing ABC transporter permease subunit [Pseudomonadota bacterium]|nr:lipoprotein-releasing ABC transporter permease subunit [Pseudomonadota bacterium]
MMFSLFERFVAFRYLRARRQEGFVSVIAWFSFLGIMLGVATLIIVMSVMNGFRQELLGRILGLNGHVNVYAASGGPLPDFDPLASQLRLMQGVKSVTPVIEGQVLVTAPGGASGALVRGVRPEDLKARPTLAGHLVAGSLDGFEGMKVVIGARMADRLSLKPGDVLPVISPRTTPGPFGMQPRMASYEVAAVFDIGMFEYDNVYVFMPLDAAQALFRVPAAVTSLEVMIENPVFPLEMRRTLSKAVGEGVRVLSWQDTNSSFFSALQVERNVMFLILSLIILVAAFNIISSMIMLVKDKGKDIAILRTMGATRGMIMRIFFLSGASIGFLGTAVGLVIGILFAENIEAIRQGLQSLTGWQLFPADVYFLTHLPAEVDYGEVARVVLMALALSFGATLYPSWRAARLDPVEALRYE